MQASLHFAIPGNLGSLTGGYTYDRRLIQEFGALGLATNLLTLSASFPFPDAAALEHADSQFTQLADNSVVLADGLAFGAMAQCVLKHSPRLRFIALCHHPLALETGMSAAQQAALMQSEKTALDCARAIVVTSHATALTLQTQFAIDAAKISVALPGCDIASFAPCRGNPPVLLTVATLTKRKAHDNLIAALAAIAHLPWIARFVGGDTHDVQWASYLRQQVSLAGLSERILFLGAIDNLEHEYQQADLFVLPSHYEGYGMAYAEAIAHGLPTIATNCGAVSELVPATAGRVIAVNDLDALRDALRELLQNTALRKQLQQGAREASTQLPKWQNSAQRIAQLVQAIAQ